MIDIICIRGLGDKEASEISDPLIVTEHIAVQRGKHFIDSKWYKVRGREVRAPFKDSTDIASVASVNESALNIAGNHIITKHRINISRQGVFSFVGIEQHEEGE